MVDNTHPFNTPLNTLPSDASTHYHLNPPPQSTQSIPTFNPHYHSHPTPPLSTPPPLSIPYTGTAFVKFDSPAAAQACVQFASVGDDSDAKTKGPGSDKGSGSVGGVSSSEVGLKHDHEPTFIISHYKTLLCNTLYVTLCNVPSTTPSNTPYLITSPLTHPLTHTPIHHLTHPLTHPH